MRLLRFFLLLLICSLPAHAALSGHLVYRQNGAAFVLRLPNGKPQMLPNSHRARLVTIAPRGGNILYYASKKGDGSDEIARLSKPPYKTATVLKLPTGFSPDKAQWTGDGNKILLSNWQKSYLYHVPSGALKPIFGDEPTLSRDGKLLAFNAENELHKRKGQVLESIFEKELRVRDLTSGKERVIFNVAHPQTVFEALKRGSNQKNLKELKNSIAPNLWKDASMWNFGSCAFAADNSRLFWTCNAGIGAGAAGNTTFCWFSTDLKTGRTSVLSKAGAQFARLPYDVQISPDGKKLLYAESVHSSAIENPVSVSILDLLTQRISSLERLTDNKKADLNLVNGMCWSPDGKAVAASAFYYDAATAWKEQEKLSAKEQNWEPREGDFTLYIRDLNNRTLKKIKGAVAPQWGL